MNRAPEVKKMNELIEELKKMEIDIKCDIYEKEEKRLEKLRREIKDRMDKRSINRIVF